MPGLIEELAQFDRKQFDIKDLTVIEPGQADAWPHGSLNGYGSTFGNYDEVGEAVVPGAFKDSIESAARDGFFAASHNWGKPEGFFKDLHEDSLGLYFDANFHSTQPAQETRTIIKERLDAGKSVKLSIGYRVLDAEDTQQGRLLKKLELYEISFVTVPANKMAHVLGVKSGNSPAGFMTFTDELEYAHAAIKGAIDRAKLIQDLRLKEGRRLSKQSIEKLVELKDALQAAHINLSEFLALPEDEQAQKDAERLMQETQAAKQASLKLQSRLLIERILQ